MKLCSEDVLITAGSERADDHGRRFCVLVLIKGEMLTGRALVQAKRRVSSTFLFASGRASILPALSASQLGER